MASDPGGNAIAMQVLLLFLLTLVNAFFAGAEMAIVSVNKNKIKMLAEKGNKKARLIEGLFDDSTKFLSTIQVAITFAGFFSSASAATGISQVLGGWMAQYGIPYSSTIAVVLVTIILSYCTLVFGELVPKRIALQKAEQFSLMCVQPILVISRVLSPFIKLRSLSTNGFLRLLGMKTENLEEEISEEEIRSLVHSGRASGVFNDTQTEMIDSVFTFDDKTARDVMVPRQEVVMLDMDEPIRPQLKELLGTRLSRFPVYRDTSDNIIGILNIKDLMIAISEGETDQLKLESLLQKPYFVPDSKPTAELFREMQKTQNRMAILIDEFGGFSGITTTEDLVEEIVGDLHDEYEQEEPELIQLTSNEYQIDGLMNLDELNEELGLNLETEYYDTVSGYLIEQLGQIPQPDEHPEVQIGMLHFTVQSMEGKRIGKIHLTIQNSLKPEEAESHPQ